MAEHLDHNFQYPQLEQQIVEYARLQSLLINFKNRIEKHRPQISNDVEQSVLEAILFLPSSPLSVDSALLLKRILEEYGLALSDLQGDLTQQFFCSQSSSDLWNYSRKPNDLDLITKINAITTHTTTREIIDVYIETQIEHLALLYTNPKPISELSDETGYSVFTLRDLIRKGQLPGFQADKEYFTYEEQLQLYTEKQKTGKPGSPRGPRKNT